MLRVSILLSLLQQIASQSFMDLPDYGPLPYPPSPIMSQPNPMTHLYRNKINTQFRRDSNDQQHGALKKFYELDLLKNYQLNFTDWSFIWFEYEEMSVKNQTALIGELREKQKTMEKILIQLCQDKCLREICEMPINQQTNGILPRNSDSWLRFQDMAWEDMPLKIKKLIILQLKIDRFRTASSLTMMVNELCPYSKYFEDVQGNRNVAGVANETGSSKIHANDHPAHNNLDGKPIEN